MKPGHERLIEIMATSYNIYESDNGTDPFNYLDSVSPSTPSGTPATTYTATGLTAATTPSFYVTAEDASGESLDQSNTASLANPIPTGVSNVTTNVGSSDGSGGTSTAPVTITWTPDPAALGYLIGRADDPSGTASLIATVPGEASDSYTDTTAEPTLAYTYTVQPYYSLPIPTTLDSNGSGSSSTADDYTGNITGFKSTINPDGTVTLSWGYQGSAGFELEKEDQSDPSTNYSTVPNVQIVTTPSGYSATVGVSAGDDYGFRVRADRSDGTASPYVGGNSDIPASTPQPTMPGPNQTLPAPNPTDVTPLGGGGGGQGYDSMNIDGGANNPADPSNSDHYNWYASVYSDRNNPLNVPEPVNTDFDAGGEPMPDAPGVSVGLDGTSGDTYQLTVAVAGYWNTSAYSPQSAPFSVTTGGTLPPKLSLQVSSSDPSTVTWDLPDGIDPEFDSDNPATIDFYYTAKSDGQEVARHAGNTYLTSRTFTFSYLNLPDGTSSVFAVYQGQSDDGTMCGYSPYSDDVQVTPSGALSAPGGITATAVMQSDGTDEVAVHWVNTPDNETGYELQRSVGGGGRWAQIVL